MTFFQFTTNAYTKLLYRPVIVLYERNDNLSFDPVMKLESLAFLDNVWMSERIKTPEYIRNIFIPDHLNCVPLEIKREMRDIPIFRRAVKTKEGFVTSPTLALQYPQISAQNIKLGMDAGFENEFYFYTLRRGAGEALNSTLRHCPLSLIGICSDDCRDARRFQT